jgi:probable phosphoglycerate mutase
MMLLGALLLAAAADPLAGLPPPAAGTVRVYAVRHGQANSNLDPQPDLPPAELDRLTPLGHQQSHAVGEALAARGVTLILTSPLRRARQTASDIRSVLRRPAVRVEPDLRPLEVGRSATGEPLAFEDRLAEWKTGRDPTPPGGESLTEVGRRVLAVATRLARSGRRGGVVFVAHSEVIAAFLGLVRGQPGAASYPPGVKNGSISVVDVPATGHARLLVTDLAPQAVVAR